MNILVINTAGERIEIALKAGERTSYYTNTKKEMASIVLLPEIQRLVFESGLTLSSIDYFCAVIGPGSFTGIRIGIATVRAFCQSLKKKCIAVNRLELLAYNNKTRSTHGNIVPVVDGQNGVSYIAAYCADSYGVLLPPSCVRTSDIAHYLSRFDDDVTVVSDSGLQIEGFKVLEYEFGATNLIEFALYKVRSGAAVNLDKLEPLYIRKAQAERAAGEL